jgi:hypothetical protein
LFLLFTVKENSYLLLAQVLGLTLFLNSVRKIKGGPSWNFIKIPRKYLFFGTALGIHFYIYLYSSEYRHFPGVLDGLYRKSLKYWFEQHTQKRIDGPFSFQFLILYWYELIFLGISLMASLRLSWLHPRMKKIILGLLFSAGLAWCFAKSENQWHWAYQITGFKIPLDFFLSLIFMTFPVFMTYYLYQRKQTLLAITCYFFYSSFFTYSYVGEKVPWLALYPFLSGVAFLSVYFSTVYIPKKRMWLLTGMLLTYGTYFSLKSSHKRDKQHLEVLDQVHTSRQFHTLMKNHQKLAPTPFNKMLVKGISVWPAAWYLRERGQYAIYHPSLHQITNFSHILVDPTDPLNSEIDQTKYDYQKISLRGWWAPHFEQLNFLRSTEYAFLRKQWNPSGEQKINYYTRKSTRPSI